MSFLGTGFGGASGSYPITNSARFNGTSDYLSRTFSAGTSRQKMTISLWIKRGALNTGTATYQELFTAGTNAGGAWNGFHFTGSSGSDVADKLQWMDGATSYGWNTTALYRDPGAWSHILLAIDTTQATAAQRVRLYVNGVENTSLTTETYNGQPAQNTTLQAYGNNVTHRIGSYSWTGAAYYSGYISEFYYIDGQQLNPTSFGKTDSNGVWTPIKYAGTYGTNGCKLEFKSSGALGTDTSGNGNNWTVSGSPVQTTDTPTNNYCTWNPLTNIGSAGTLSNGNLNYLSPISALGSGRGTFAVNTGKWYWEVTMTTGTSTFCPGTGIAEASLPGPSDVTDANNAGYIYSYTGAFYGGGSSHAGSSIIQSGLSTYSSGAVVGVALDCDSNTLKFYLSGSQIGSTINIESGHTWTMYANDHGGAANVNFLLNCGQSTFAYTPPTGYLPLNTTNLPSVAVTTSGTFTGNANADGPFIWTNGNPATLTINGNAVTFGTHADKTAGGFKLRSSSASYNTSGSNTWTATAGKRFVYSATSINNAQGNP